MGYVIIELGKLLMYKTYHDVLQPFFGPENLQRNYMDTDRLVLSVNTNVFIEGLSNPKDMFDFSNSNKKYSVFSNVNKKFPGSFKKETSNSIWLDEIACLRSEAYPYEYSNVSETTLKGVTKLIENNKSFEEFQK